MTIFYLPENETWIQNEQENCTFGGLKKEIRYESNFLKNQGILFDLQLKDQHIGPLIGIMTASKSENSLAGNSKLFIDIQQGLLKRNALSFIFSYEDLKESGSIIGYIYLPSYEKWLRVKMPFPDIVYNRIPFRKSEQTVLYQQCVALFQQFGIPIFNPGFIDKFDLFQILKSKNNIKRFLPKTILIDSMENLELFFNQYEDIYLKPRKHSKGKNIYRLYFENEQLVLETHGQREFFSNFVELWNQHDEMFYKIPFIAQRTIQPDLLNGFRYDFRVLTHWDVPKQKYIVTGIGIRATEQHGLTTHTTNGGFIIPYQSIRTDEHDRFIKMIVEEIGMVLSNKLGFFGEFSIDAGLNSGGKYVVYEVNSKPMSFDEEEIERKRIQHLCQLFFQLTGFDDK
ncbi:YheC/YheD family protein [Bacillus sp. CGMCC 1.16607]|uniref:YheC/YheD family endospore coat-associated protein n=1 Tax=Bacillus sp. CGMCC 1.16607 TaxID=3351842 RepID=UPI00363BD2D1